MNLGFGAGVPCGSLTVPSACSNLAIGKSFESERESCLYREG